MAYRPRSINASSLLGDSLEMEPEEADPRVGLVNLADVMLVFAAGLMVALVTYWNLDIAPQMTEVVQTENLSEVQGDIEEGQTTMSESGTGYEELGVVYRDPQTGKMYMMTQDEGK